MIATGCRVSSVTGTTLAGLGRDRGHTTLDLPVKGGRTQRLVLPPLAADAVDRYLHERDPRGHDLHGRRDEHDGQQHERRDERGRGDQVASDHGDASVADLPAALGRAVADAPLFATRTGRPIDQPYVFRLIRRVAKAAGIAHADRLSPHSLRHSVATLLLDRGHPLHVVQDFLGHADPRATRRYDTARQSWTAHPPTTSTPPSPAHTR